LAFRVGERDETGDFTEDALVGGLMESESQQAGIATARMLEWICKGLGAK
jgi:hypothetical protein